MSHHRLSFNAGWMRRLKAFCWRFLRREYRRMRPSDQGPDPMPNN